MEFLERKYYRKINIYYKGEYQASTIWRKTCKDAKKQYIKLHPMLEPKEIKAFFDERKEQ